ncbi:MAG TPA: YbjQ family protein [Thermoanaerobaculia bacterium]|nr:YbjQ family protein [Thermoanaerobaculia bacterium]
MIVTTAGGVAGKRVIRTLGLVRGNTIRARHVGRDITAALRTLVGGEIAEYTKLFAEAREQAIDRMVEEAQSLGADAIIDMRFSTSMVMSGAAELLAYGTAVKLADGAG